MLAVLVGCTEVTGLRCPINGLGETDAELFLARRGERIERFSYAMDRPVGEGAHDCDLSAKRRYLTVSRDMTGFAPSSWSESDGVTRVWIPDGPGTGNTVVNLTERPNGLRMEFVHPQDCGTFLLPEAVEVEWSEQGCTGRPINWDQPGTEVVNVGSFSTQSRVRVETDDR